jgi:SET domain-containing protein
MLRYVSLSRMVGLGRFLSHSKLHANLLAKVYRDKNDHPRILFHAAKDIAANEELRFDYGDRDETAIASFPWLAL